jgi:hypothetical protein
MDSDLEYSFITVYCTGMTVCIAQNDEIGFRVEVSTTQYPCTDKFRLIAMIREQRNLLVLQESG